MEKSTLPLALVFTAPLYAAEPQWSDSKNRRIPRGSILGGIGLAGMLPRRGITSDLEAIKRIGLGGAQVFSVDVSHVWVRCC